MKQRIALALLTVVIVTAGFFVGRWTERNGCRVPPPPSALLSELSSKDAKPAASTTASPNAEAAKLAAEIERLHPQIEQFRARLEQIEQELNEGIEAMLNEEQKAKFAELVQRGAQARAQETAQSEITAPLTPDEIRDLQQRSLHKLLGIVVIGFRLEWNTKQLNLDDAQKRRLEELLKIRREKFIQLVDSSPPPSMKLSRLAPLARRLVNPEATQPAANK